eukprot:scpid31403/ scgid3956/ Hemicentin-1; Fibulin-6
MRSLIKLQLAAIIALSMLTASCSGQGCYQGTAKYLFNIFWGADELGRGGLNAVYNSFPRPTNNVNCQFLSSPPSLSALADGLEIDSGTLSNIPLSVYQKWGNLRVLTLHSLSAFSLTPGMFLQMPKLNYLKLRRIPLTHLPADLGSLNELRILLITDCSLQHLPAGIFDNMTELVQLHLSGNSFTSLPQMIFQHQNKLLDRLEIGIYNIPNIQLCPLHVEPGIWRNAQQRWVDLRKPSDPSQLHRKQISAAVCNSNCSVMIQKDNRCPHQNHTCVGTVQNYTCVPHIGIFPDYCPPLQASMATFSYSTARRLGDTAVMTCGSGFHADVNGISFDCLEHVWEHGVWSGAPGCQDTDECSLRTHSCNHAQTCFNTIGSFTCCAFGYTYGYKSSACQLTANYCSALTVKNGYHPPTLHRTLGAAGRVSCNSGYESTDTVRCTVNTGEGGTWIVGTWAGFSTVTCHDIDECGRGTHNCNAATSKCYNLVGKFICCPFGYQGFGGTCQLVPNYCPRIVSSTQLYGVYQTGFSLTSTTVVGCGAGQHYPFKNKSVCTASSTRGVWLPLERDLIDQRAKCEDTLFFCPNITRANGVVTYHDAGKLGSAATLACNNGYEPAAHTGTHLWCFFPGSWSDTFRRPMTSCQLVADYCPLPRIAHGGFGDGVSRRLGNSATLACDDAYVPGGNVKATCTAGPVTGKGAWSYNGASCVLRQRYCSSGVVSNGRMTPSSSIALGSVFTIVCLNPYYVLGNASVACMKHNATVGKLNITGACSDEFVCPGTSVRLFVPPPYTIPQGYSTSSQACQGYGRDLPSKSLSSCVTSFAKALGMTGTFWLKGTSVGSDSKTVADTTSGKPEPVDSTHHSTCATTFQYKCPSSDGTLVYPAARGHYTGRDYASAASECNSIGARLPDHPERSCVQRLAAVNGDVASNKAWLRDRPGTGMALLSDNTRAPVTNIYTVICMQSGANDYCPFAYVSNSQIGYKSRDMGAKATVSCIEGYTRTGVSEITCAKDTATSGKWSGVVHCDRESYILVTWCAQSA